MPRITPNYSESIIYKLCCLNSNITDIYVGSTTNFKARKNQHKNNSCNENNKKYNYAVYKFIRDNGGWDNWDMIQVEQYNADSKRMLEMRERHWLETLKSTLNMYIPTRNKKEFGEIYREKNREQINENKKKHYQTHKEDYKEYYERNKIKILEQRKEYHKLNKDKIKKHKSELFDCACGGRYTFSHKARHFRTKQHSFYQSTLDYIYF